MSSPAPLLQGFFLLAHIFMVKQNPLDIRRQNQDENNMNGSLTNIDDARFSRKGSSLHTCYHALVRIVTYAVSLTAGILLGILGPSLPDLKCLYDVELTTLSYLLLAFGLGGILGQILVPSLLKRVPTYLLLASVLALLSTFFFLLTYTDIYIGYLLTFVAALTSGCALNVVLYKSNMMWPGNARVVYLIFSIIALGSVLSPLVLQPFLSDGSVTRSYRLTSSLNTSVYKPQTALDETVSWKNHSEKGTFVNGSYVNGSLGYIREGKTKRESCYDFITFMQYPFIIFGLLALPTIGMFIYFHSREQKVTPKSTYVELQENNTSYSRSEYLFICMMFVVFLQGQGFPTGYSALLSTYGTESPLAISLSKMTWMTSLFWFSFLIARLTPSFFPSQVRQLHILIGCVFGLSVSMVILCFSLNNEALLWVGTCMAGLFTAPVVPAGMAWAREVITMTPVLRSVFLTGVAFGFVFPFFGGTLISKLGTDAFPYSFLGFDILTAIVLTIAVISVKVNGNL